MNSGYFLPFKCPLICLECVKNQENEAWTLLWHSEVNAFKKKIFGRLTPWHIKLIFFLSYFYIGFYDLFFDVMYVVYTIN